MKLTPKQEVILAALKRGARIHRVADIVVPSRRRLAYPEYADHYTLFEEGVKGFIRVDRRTVKKFQEAGLIVPIEENRWKINPEKGGEAHEI